MVRHSQILLPVEGEAFPIACPAGDDGLLLNKLAAVPFVNHRIDVEVALVVLVCHSQILLPVEGEAVPIQCTFGGDGLHFNKLSAVPFVNHRIDLGAATVVLVRHSQILLPVEGEAVPIQCTAGGDGLHLNKLAAVPFVNHRIDVGVATAGVVRHSQILFTVDGEDFPFASPKSRQCQTRAVKRRLVCHRTCGGQGVDGFNGCGRRIARLVQMRDCKAAVACRGAAGLKLQGFFNGLHLGFCEHTATVFAEGQHLVCGVAPIHTGDAVDGNVAATARCGVEDLGHTAKQQAVGGRIDAADAEANFGNVLVCGLCHVAQQGQGTGGADDVVLRLVVVGSATAADQVYGLRCCHIAHQGGPCACHAVARCVIQLDDDHTACGDGGLQFCRGGRAVAGGVADAGVASSNAAVGANAHTVHIKLCFAARGLARSDDGCNVHGSVGAVQGVGVLHVAALGGEADACGRWRGVCVNREAQR